MKRVKKILAGFLTLAMTMSLMTMTAFAADGDKMPTIDTKKAVSLTIHKYEYNGDVAEDDRKGTGSSSDETTKIPVGAEPLEGVTFTIWKVADLDTYYGVENGKLPEVSDYILSGTGTAATLTKGGTEIAGKISGVTDVNGKITFDQSKVRQGLYYVSETGAPANVTSKTADFLVSLPMTNATGDDWLYDVHVFPKNKTTYGGVTLVKQGKDGSKTATALEGTEFILQMKNEAGGWDYLGYDTTKKWTYTGVTKDSATKFKTAEDGTINVKDLTAGTYRFIEVSAPNGYIVDGTKKYQFTIDTDGKVTWQEDAVGIGTTTGEGAQYSATVIVTNYKPDAEKFVKDRKTNAWEADADYRAEAKVPYLIKVDIPENVAQLKTFKLTDTMTHLTYVQDSFKIYAEKKDDYTNEPPILTDIAPEVSNGNKTWTINFNKVENETITSSVSEYKGKSIYLYFEATLDNDAEMTSNGNPNNITLDYSNAIYPTTDPSNPNNGNTPGEDHVKDVVNVFTFGIEVVKQDGSDGTALQGVEFDLYRVNDEESLPADGKVTETWLKTDGHATRIASGKKTNAEGKLSFDRLDNATYYLVETKTNESYNLLKEPYKAELNLTATITKETNTITDENGVTTKETTIKTTDYGKGDGANNGKFSVIVKNYKGFTLPTTGGIGTFVFTFAGIAMMAAAVILLITGKKKKAE